MRPATALLSLVLLASLAALVYGIAGLADIGTCASGGPYVVANECPDGTGVKMAYTFAGSTVFIIGSIAASFRSFSAGMFWFGALFVALGGAFLTGEQAIMGALFAAFGLLPLLGGAKGLLEEREEAKAGGPAPFMGPLIVGTVLAQAPQPQPQRPGEAPQN